MEANNANTGKVFCSSCGAANIEGSKFCSNCGAKIIQLSIPITDQHVNQNLHTNSEKKGWLKWLQGIVVAIATFIGYKLGGSILTGMSYTSWERHVVETNTSGYTSGLRSQFAGTELVGGIVGAILLFVISLVIVRLLSRKR